MENRSSKSLAKPKPTFGEALRTAIKAEFGTNKAFAERLRVSEGRVSQMIKGPESITAQSLDEILRCFTSLSRQQAIYEAWLETFAPCPLARLTRSESEDQAHKLLAELDPLVTSGQARQSLTALEVLRTPLKDLELRFWVLRAITETSMYLRRSEQAQRASSELRRQAQSAGDPEWIGRALWLEAIVAKNSPSTTFGMKAKRLDEAMMFVSAWNPADGPNRELARQMRSAVSRDRVIALIDLNERKPIDEVQFEQALQGLNTTLGREMSNANKALYLEVKARLLLAMNDIEGCEESLDEVYLSKGFVSYDHDSKTAILQGQLFMTRNIPQKATDVLETGLDRCYAADDLHHAGIIEGQLSRMALLNPSNR